MTRERDGMGNIWDQDGFGWMGMGIDLDKDLTRAKKKKKKARQTIDGSVNGSRNKSGRRL